MWLQVFKRKMKTRQWSCARLGYGHFFLLYSAWSIVCFHSHRKNAGILDPEYGWCGHSGTIIPLQMMQNKQETVESGPFQSVFVEDSCTTKLTSPMNCCVSGLQWASTGRTWNTMYYPRSRRRWQQIAWNGLKNTIPVSTEQHCVHAGIFVSYFLRQEKLL